MENCSKLKLVIHPSGRKVSKNRGAESPSVTRSDCKAFSKVIFGHSAAERHRIAFYEAIKADWTSANNDLDAEIKIRHYSQTNHWLWSPASWRLNTRLIRFLAVGDRDLEMSTEPSDSVYCCITDPKSSNCFL